MHLVQEGKSCKLRRFEKESFTRGGEEREEVRVEYQEEPPVLMECHPP
jgi:hypothetical protein